MDETPIWVKGSSYEQCPTGMQAAVCSAVHNLGTQPGYRGQGTRHMIGLIFELAACQTEGDFAGKRFLRSTTYTASLGDRSNLRRDLESWRGRAFAAKELELFNVRTIAGKNCTLNLVEKPTNNGRTCVVIANVLPPIKGQKKLVPEQPGFMPDWMAEKYLADSDTNHSAIPDADDFDDDIPF